MTGSGVNNVCDCEAGTLGSYVLALLRNVLDYHIGVTNVDIIHYFATTDNDVTFSKRWRHLISNRQSQMKVFIMRSRKRRSMLKM